MDAEELIPIIAILSLFIGLPWIILHYVSQWRRAKGISVEDENLLDDLHETARRLDSRLDSIERIIAADNPNWKDGGLAGSDRDRLSDQRAAAIDNRIDFAERRLGQR